MFGAFRRLAIASSAALLLIPMLAFGAEERTARYERMSQLKTDDLRESRLDLESSPKEAWFAAQVEEYLSDALWVVYFGVVLYMNEHGALPSDINTLKGSHYVSEWPANPFNDWEPMKVGTTSTFSPGDLHFQAAPPSAYSGLKNPRPLSFELAVFGPTEEFAVNGHAEALRNTWATVPPGALYMVGVFTESSASLRKKFDRAMQQRERAATESGTDGDQQ